MQHLEVSGAVRLIYGLLGVKGLKNILSWSKICGLFAEDPTRRRCLEYGLTFARVLANYGYRERVVEVK